MTNEIINSEIIEKARAYGINYIINITDDMLDASLVADLPIEWTRSNCVLPVKIGQRLCVLLKDPSNLEVQEEIALILKQKPEPIIAPETEILRAIEKCYYNRSRSPSEFSNSMISADKNTTLASPQICSDLLHVEDQAPVIQLVNLILLDAVKAGASDIHFEPFESALRIRYRIDGVLFEKTSHPKHLEAALIARLKIMGHMDVAETRLPQDGMARVNVGKKEIDIRISTVPIADGERVVLRLLDRESALLPMDALGMSEQVMRAVKNIIKEPNGIFIVCGPTGSGKTTTLYASLSEMDAKRRNIMTVSYTHLTLPTIYSV